MKLSIIFIKHPTFFRRFLPQVTVVLTIKQITSRTNIGELNIGLGQKGTGCNKSRYVMLVIFSDPFQGYILYAFLFFIFSCMA